MIRDTAPKFFQFVSIIDKKNSLQKKAVHSFLDSQDNRFWERAEHFADNLSSLLNKQGITREYVVDSYLKMCRNMLVEQIKFKKTGRYSLRTADQAQHLYSSEKEMVSYMYGLALSCFLWPNHYSIYDFFISETKKLKNISTYLEIGPGHGLYLVESVKHFPHAKFEAVDISPISSALSEAIVTHFTRHSLCEFRVQDVNHLGENRKYDYIVMCEVLEHLDDPFSVLKKLRKILHDQGQLFLTTCANCPAVDHVYLYKSIDHIRREIQEAGFEILSDLPLAVENVPESEWYEKSVEINYAAMVKRG